LFREVLKSAKSGVLAVIVNHHGLTEFEFRGSPIDTGVLLIANWKRVVTVVFSTSATFTLTDSPKARLLPARYMVLICGPKAQEEDAEQ
jgi:hypothetical protein